MENKTARQFWVNSMLKIAHPVLTALANRELKKTLPLTFHPERKSFAPLEAFARTVCGIAPWLELESLTGEEEKLRAKYTQLVLEGLDVATDPHSPDCMNFGDKGEQPLVDAGFLSQALVRAPKHLIWNLTPRVKQNLAAALKRTRTITPAGSNWLFFSAMVEAALFLLGEPDYDKMRIGYAVEMFYREWYKGDGVYGDGKDLHWDYYNSFVIQPMFVDIITLFEHNPARYVEMKPVVLARASRYAAILERMIAPDGTYPIVGRSIVYRFGAFHMLSQAALRHLLPAELPPAQVRCALQATIQRIMQCEKMFDENGWLLPGVYGCQPGLAEEYINTGSLYLCSTVFLALGLPPEDNFWSGEDLPWTSCKVWGGKDLPADHAIRV